MAFETVPVVHVVDGAFPEYPQQDPERVLGALARRFERIALVDAEGVRRNEPALEFVQAAARRRSLWLDAGSRYAEDAMDLFVAGAEAVTMRWNTLDSPKELEAAAELAQPDALFLGLEYPKGAFLPHRAYPRSAREVAAWAASLGVGLVFLLDEPDAHLLRSLPEAPTARWLQNLPRRLVDDAQAMGYRGALVPPAEIPPEASA